MKLLLSALLAFTATAGLASASALAGTAHQRGVAKIDMAVEAGRVTLNLETPLDKLLGFERAPRSEAKRQQAADALFHVDGSSGCKLSKVTLASVALGLPAPAAAAAKDEHADLAGRFEFTCTAGVRAGFVEANLFDAFPQLKRVELDLVLPKGQMKATLLRPTMRVALVR